MKTIFGNLKVTEEILNWDKGSWVLYGDKAPYGTLYPCLGVYELPDLNQYVFQGNNILIDLYNALVNAIQNYSFVGKYWDANPNIDRNLVMEIVKNIPSYRGEAFLNIERINNEWIDEHFFSFSDDPINKETLTPFYSKLIYSVPLYRGRDPERDFIYIEETEFRQILGGLSR